ncbi:sulfite oxidase [Desulfosporosinus nitroreducens]|uniref:sulfite oxidase n=1 Tax=Desulfosporosinus nitroreducens TaxID=2018668 RepID=UPI00207C8B58|nr:sulfite oxidase [Desulfosporosinus nitroreducens]MCO1603348.1 sulfite oxidase [Desulfosporosinus nitroreducens]
MKPTITPFLTTRKLNPENQETPIHFLPQTITPKEYFFIRNHFEYPTQTQEAYFLPIVGEVIRPIIFKLEDIMRMPSKHLMLPLECSGNNRAFFHPKVYGEQWEDGAISQGLWKGVPLKDLLALIGLKRTALEVVFEAYDYGKRMDLEGDFHFARSLPIQKALHPDTLIAYELNGKPIPFKHGYPLRLIVPQWYAMASIKWVKRIVVIDHLFKGPFQEIDYNYYPYKDSDKGKTPVAQINVSSIIQQPQSYSILDNGKHVVEGIAWTGTGVIIEVEVSTDGGESWHKAILGQEQSHLYSWTFWKYDWKVSSKGEYLIMSRARDSFGNIQPFKAKWNRKGYGYNAVYTVKVKVE